jgi:hypothetical protein
MLPAKAKHGCMFQRQPQLTRHPGVCLAPVGITLEEERAALAEARKPGGWQWGTRQVAAAPQQLPAGDLPQLAGGAAAAGVPPAGGTAWRSPAAAAGDAGDEGAEGAEMQEQPAQHSQLPGAPEPGGQSLLGQHCVQQLPQQAQQQEQHRQKVERRWQQARHQAAAYIGVSKGNSHKTFRTLVSVAGTTFLILDSDNAEVAAQGYDRARIAVGPKRHRAGCMPRTRLQLNFPASNYDGQPIPDLTGTAAQYQ